MKLTKFSLKIVQRDYSAEQQTAKQTLTTYNLQ